MKNNYIFKNLVLIFGITFLFTVAACKKDKSSSTSPAVATPVKLGLYTFGSTSTYNYRQLQINVSKIGTQTASYGLVFDTGSGGMVIDANGIVPASVITSTGFSFTGDSTIVNGITITKYTSTIAYGANDSTMATVYGNLAYAPVTIGDVNGNITIKRLPFFLYYKASNAKGVKYDAHEFDVMGVLDQYAFAFSNGVNVTSPFTYYDPGTGLTKGFKMAALGATNFSSNGYATFVPNVLSLGLTASDLSSSSGFTFAQLTFYQGYGYIPYLPATITYGTKTTTGYVVFDSGTDPYSYIEDKAATGTSILPVNTAVKVATNAGYTYNYTTTSSDFPTVIENPNTSGGGVSIFGLQTFLDHQYLLDYTNHKIGLK